MAEQTVCQNPYARICSLLNIKKKDYSLAVRDRNTTFAVSKTDKMTQKGIKRHSHIINMLFFAFTIVMLTVVVACSKLTREQRRVRRAAEKSYAYLQEGKYERFVGALAYADSMSDDYRAQMVDLVKAFAAKEEKLHGKLLSATVTGDTIIGEQAHVYLQVTYADSTSEEIGLPMVKVGKKWKMQ